MFGNVLVGVDGPAGGRDAVALARQLASAPTRITLAHIYGADWLGGRGGGESLALQRADSVRLLAHERAEAGIDAELVSFGDVPPARGLHELAERIHSDLLVVGSSRRGKVGRVLLGDDTCAALNGSPCAIAIAPRGYAEHPHRLAKVGVGYDCSPESVYAVAAARDLGTSLGASLTALSVVSLEDMRERDPWLDAATDVMAQRIRALRELRGVDGRAIFGEPREELVRFGGDVDLLIVGSRGVGPVGRVLHGSVSSYLARHAPCPVLVLPRAVVLAASEAA